MAIKICESEFKWAWKKIYITHVTEKHCLVNGCGKETLSYWITMSTHVIRHPNYWRKILNEAVNRKWAEKKQSATGHSIFILK